MPEYDRPQEPVIFGICMVTRGETRAGVTSFWHGMVAHYERRRLAVKDRVLGRRALDELAGLVTPDTILRW